jgi:hypothetical protein
MISKQTDHSLVTLLATYVRLVEIAYEFYQTPLQYL